MADISYLDFDLTIRRSPRGYSAEASSPTGEPRADLAFDLEDLLSSRVHLEKFRDAYNTSTTGWNRQDPDAREKVKLFGTKLFESVFTGEIRACFSNSLEKARGLELGLRIRLRLTDVPELLGIPWEFLYNRSLGRFLSLSDQTPIVRHIPLPETAHSLLVKPPLRILVVISSPSDYPRLNGDKEWQFLRSSLAPLLELKLIDLHRAPKATTDCLQDCLSSREFHIIHFIGHGGFDPSSENGLLLMEDESGHGLLIEADSLRILLDHFHLRLVVLNSCEGARSGSTDIFSGVAQSLIEQGIPAVIAMQFEITDEAAITFAKRFYGAISDGRPVDMSLAAARKAMFVQVNPFEWATPVLYMRCLDGKIFHIDKPSEEEQRQARIELLLRDARSALDRRDYGSAINKIETLRSIDGLRDHVKDDT